MRGHRFIRSVGTVASGTMVGQSLLLLSAPVVTRLYAPEEWGTLAAFTAVLYVLLPISALRLELTIPMASRDLETAGLVRAASWAVTLMVVVSTVAVALGGDALASWTDAPGLGALLWVLPVGVALGGAYKVLSHWAVRQKEFSTIARAEVSRPFTKAAVQIGLGLWRGGPAGLIVGEVSGNLGGLVPLYRRARRHLAGVSSELTRAYVVGLIKRHWRFPAFTAPGSLFSALSSHLPLLLMAGLYGPQAAGWLGLSERVVVMPSSFLGVSIGKVYLSRAGGMAGRDAAGLRRLFVRTALVLFAIGSLMALLLALAGPHLFAAVFSDEWYESGRYARLLVPLFIGQFVLSPMSATLDLIQRQAVKFVWHLVRLGVVLAAFLVPYGAGAPPSTAVAIYGLGVGLLYGALFVLTLRAVGPDTALQTP